MSSAQGAASVAAAWWFADEVTPATEAANVLLHAERRRRIARALADRLLGVLGGLPIDVEPPPRTPARALDLARAHRLSVSAAMCLEVAIRPGLPLATLDGDLTRAARAAGVARVP